MTFFLGFIAQNLMQSECISLCKGYIGKFFEDLNVQYDEKDQTHFLNFYQNLHKMFAVKLYIAFIPFLMIFLDFT